MSKQIVQIMKEVVAKVEQKVLTTLQQVNSDIKTIHYEHGHYIEINTTLQERDASKSFFNKKYPLVALFEDIKEVQKFGYKECSLTMVICFSTKEEYKSEDRYNDVIKPILEPIYLELLNQLQSHPDLMGYENPPHNKINRPYWGVPTKNGNIENIFSDFLDAIEINNLKLKYKDTNC